MGVEKTTKKTNYYMAILSLPEPDLGDMNFTNKVKGSMDNTIIF